MPQASSPPSKSGVNSLPDALLLATTGGMLDAVVYLLHGRVFVNAMTGNVIFLGIALVGRDWREIVPHVAPLVGFVFGVWTSIHLRTRLRSHAATAALGFEIVALFLLAFVPLSFSHTTFTITLAFVTAFQVATFRRVEHFAFNSTFLTGNLRDAIEGFYNSRDTAATAADRSDGRAQATDLGLICLCFLLGAVTGAWSAPHFGNYSLWLAIPLLLAVLLRTLRRHT